MENNRKYQGSFDTRIFWYQYRIDIVWEVATINIPELINRCTGLTFSRFYQDYTNANETNQTISYCLAGR